MWAVNRYRPVPGQAVNPRQATFPHHLHIDLQTSSNTFSTVTANDPLDPSQSAPNRISSLNGGQFIDNLGLCGGFAANYSHSDVSNAEIKFALGSRYAVRLKRIHEPTLASDNGKAGWVTHRTGTANTTAGNRLIEYTRVELLDNGSVTESATTQLESTFSGNIVAGFCRIDGDLKLCAWHTTLIPLSEHGGAERNESGFGATVSFLASDVEDEDANPEALLIDWTGTLSRLLPLATKLGHFEDTIPGLPLSLEQLYERAGKTLCSFTQPLLHIIRPRIDFPTVDRDFGRTAYIDTQNHGTLDRASTLTSFYELVSQCFAVSSEAYEFSDTMPYLPLGTTGNIHHDPEVNERLSRILVEFTGDAQVIFDPLPGCLNVWKADVDVERFGVPRKFHGLLSLFRQDTVVGFTQTAVADRFSAWSFAPGPIDFSYLDKGESVHLEYDLGSDRSITVTLTGVELGAAISATAQGIGFEVSYAGRPKAYGAFSTGTTSINPIINSVSVSGQSDGLVATQQQLISLLGFSVYNPSTSDLPQPVRSFRNYSQRVQYWLLLSSRFQDPADANSGETGRLLVPLHRSSVSATDDKSEAFFSGQEIEQSDVKFTAIGPAT
jgi:hypothetical protein